MSHYQILDVAADATPEQIRNAWRILVQLHHPDRLQQVPANVREYAEERLKKINEAYQVLSDPERRARYDVAQAAARPAAGQYAWDEDYAADETAWAGRRRRPRRQRSAAEAEAAAAYDAWAHQEAERYAAQREAERARRAERENREAEERARRAAQERFPRLRRDADGGLVVHFAPGVWAGLVRVPAGEFLMGSAASADEAAASAEQPQHTVYVSEFYVARFPVTNAQFQAFTRAARHALPAPLPTGLDTHPVVEVDWDDADAFCKWLSRETGRSVRLPTEAEWEKAARGEDGRLFPWGNAWDAARANARPEAEAAADGGPGRHAGAAPVDATSPAGDSPYGAAGMSGNVWEWCSDWYDARTYARRARGPVRDPSGPLTGTGYVARGGAYDSTPRQARCASRNWFYPHDRRPNLGFRVVVEGF